MDWRTSIIGIPARTILEYLTPESAETAERLLDGRPAGEREREECYDEMKRLGVFGTWMTVIGLIGSGHVRPLTPDEERAAAEYAEKNHLTTRKPNTIGRAIADSAGETADLAVQGGAWLLAKSREMAMIPGRLAGDFVRGFAESMGVPPWAIYVGVGILGVGVLALTWPRKPAVPA